MTNLLLLNKFPWWDYPRVKWMAPATGYGYALILMFIILRMLAKRPQGGHQFVRRCLWPPILDDPQFGWNCQPGKNHP